MTLHVALFAKPPRPGVVKTRLSPALPAADAAALVVAFLEDTAARVARSRGARRVLYLVEDEDAPTGGDVTPVSAEWRKAFDEIRGQRGEHLGARLARAFDEMLRDPNDRALVLGADSPDLPDHTLTLAAAALERTDVVLGPARDGGYYLIGLARPQPELFDAIEWSSERVLEQTRTRAQALGLRVEELPAWWDVDEPAGLAALVARVLEPAVRARCPSTTAALVALGFLPSRLGR